MDDMVSSDSEWSSDSGYGEDQDDLEFMYGGKAQSVLSSLEQSIGRIDNFLSFERGFTIGDIVCSAADPSGQMGKVVDVHMLVDLENFSGDVIEDVNSRKLQKIRSMSCGDLVVLGSWIGRVDKVVDLVTILYDDGAKCEITTEDPDKLLESLSGVEDSQYPFYPGQRVKVRSGTGSKSTRWFCGSGKENRLQGTVNAVKPGLVYVDWFSCALFVGGFTVPPPDSVQDSKNLTLLSCFLHAHWRLGDWCIVPDSDVGSELNQVMYNPSSHSYKGHYGASGGFKQENVTKVGNTYVITNTRTKLDVLWQDGSYSMGLESASLIPVNVVNSHEFWPGEFVSEKGNFEELHVQRWGVVTAVDFKEHIVGVNWKTISGGLATQTASAYELIDHPDYKYSLGDLVVRAAHNENTSHTNTENAITPTPIKNCGKDHSEFDKTFYLSRIGYVTSFKDGCVEVTWATGLKTKVEPFEICLCEIDEISYQVSVAATAENLNTGSNEDRMFCDHKDKGKSLDHTRADKEKSAPVANLFCIPQAAVGFLSNVASRLGLKSAEYNPVNTNIIEDLCDKELLEFLPSKGKFILENETTASVDANILNCQYNDSEQSSLRRERPATFCHFDMVGNCLDHHFIDGSGKESVLSQVTRGWLKRVQQEWTNLEKNIPDTLYVRVFEERMDLMRAVVVGAPGTPYHDGLFFFDIYLPPEFPDVPPKVHYHSGGLRLNPNLYESGKVCLSLINTWTGNSTEVWNPQSSTILQILLSLQAIVLNDNPYFNEAGFDRQIGSIEGEKNAASYKENAFVLTCKSMLYLISKPPQHFEAFIVEHFTSHAPLILTAIKTYMDEGIPVGQAFDSSSPGQECSTGFKLILSKLLPKLVDSFTKMGIDCDTVLNQKN